MALLLGLGRFAEANADQLGVHALGGGDDRVAIGTGPLLDVAEIRRGSRPREQDQSEGDDDAAQAGHGRQFLKLAISGNWSLSPAGRFASGRPRPGNYRAVPRGLPTINP